MSESRENLCKICLQEISEANRASSVNGLASNTDMERAICNKCFVKLNCSIVKVEVVPLHLIEFNTDIPKILERPCNSNFFYCYQCGYCTTDETTFLIHRNNHVKDEVLRDIKPVEFVEFNTDIPKIVEGPCEGNFFYCYQCGYCTSDNTILVQHVLIHRGNHAKDKVLEEIKPLELVEFNTDIPTIIEAPCKTNFLHCYHCGYSTLKKSSLIKHIKRHRGNLANKTSFKCDVFNHSIVQPSSLKANCEKPHNTDIPTTIEAPETNFLHCLHCGYSTLSKKTLINHVNKCRDNCVDKASFNSSAVQLSHLKEHGEKSHKCTVCDYSHKHLNKLKLHMRKHTGEKPYKCKVCAHFFTRLSHLNRHMHLHTGEKPYKCKVCEYSFARLDYLKRHMYMHTGEKRYNCKVCGFSCTTSSALKRHMRTHTSEKPYKCKVCDYSTVTYGKLKEHIRTHTREKPHKCKVCDYSSVTSATLKIHMRVHTGEKPYACKVCKFSCARLEHLKYHMRTHTGEKPYICKVCRYSFATSSALKKHTRTHTGEKPYKCKVCECSYGRLDHLKLHMHTHAEEKRYNCKICNFSTTSCARLKKHAHAHWGETLQMQSL